MNLVRNRTCIEEENILTDHSEDVSKFRRKITFSRVPAATWILAVISLIITLALLGYIVIPVMIGYTTPWKLILKGSYFVEDVVRDLSGDCPRAISSHDRAEIKGTARAVTTFTYQAGMNISGNIAAQDMFVLRGFLRADIVTHFRLFPHHLKNTDQGHFKDWHANVRVEVKDIFFKDDHGLEQLDPCVAGDFTQTIHRRTVFRQIYTEIAAKLDMNVENQLNGPGITLGGPLITKSATMWPTLNHYCHSLLLVQLAGESVVYYRGAREEKHMYGVSLSPWIVAHLLPGDAIAWFPGMLYYIEPQDTWSLAAVIMDVRGAGVLLARPRMSKAAMLDDRDFLEGYANVMRDCHGAWPPTVGGNTVIDFWTQGSDDNAEMEARPGFL